MLDTNIDGELSRRSKPYGQKRAPSNASCGARLSRNRFLRACARCLPSVVPSAVFQSSSPSRSPPNASASLADNAGPPRLDAFVEHHRPTRSRRRAPRSSGRLRKA
jgi:hypothetical protein